MTPMNTGVRVNHRLFTTSVFDSGALGVLAYVIHQFPEGQYQATIYRDGTRVGTTRFRVTESANLQLNIDLATMASAARTSAPCAGRESPCAGRESDDGTPVVSPKGYVLFYVSGGAGGYSVTVGDESARRAVFDSQTLSEGDLFALSLLAPTTYSVLNRSGTAQGEIQVTPLPTRTDPRTPRTDPRTLPPVYVEAHPDTFQPSSVSLHLAQGLAFRIHGTGRIVVERRPAPAREARRLTPEGKSILRRVRVRNPAYTRSAGGAPATPQPGRPDS
jgi:hypothetical protein